MKSFGFTERQYIKFKEWNNIHKCELKNYSGAIGGRLTYSFTPTGLGLVTKVKCACGEFIDLTGYESW